MGDNEIFHYLHDKEFTIFNQYTKHDLDLKQFIVNINTYEKQHQVTLPFMKILYHFTFDDQI